MIMSPTLRHEAVCLFLPPLIPAHCPSHALLPEVPLQDRVEDSVFVRVLFVFVQVNMAEPPKPASVNSTWRI